MDAPSNAPPAKMLAPTMKPIAMGAMMPMLPLFGVHGSGVNCVDQPEGHHNLEDQCIPCADARRQ